VGAVGRKLPRSDPRLESTVMRQGKACSAAIRRSVLGCRETPGPPVSRTEPKTPWDKHAVKAAESAGNERGTGTRKFVQVAEVGRTHRRALPAGRSQGLLAELSGALARRKLEAPPDAEHEPREGETVRGRALTIISTRFIGSWVSARKLSIRRKVFSGFAHRCPHGHGEVKSSARRAISVAPSARSVSRKAHRTVQRPVGRVCERQRERPDGRRGSVKAPRGPRRPKGSSHPRR